jgi:hypothetical protein
LSLQEHFNGHVQANSWVYCNRYESPIIILQLFVVERRDGQ